MRSEIAFAPLELKFVGEGNAGDIKGYGSVFGNRDSHDDVILPGAFARVIAGHKAAGTMPAMYVQHGPMMGGDLLPAGVWTEMSEDDRGLRLEGRISALDTDYGKRVRALVQDGALKGLSIGFMVGAGNAVMGKKAGEPRRTIKSFDRLVEVSLVSSPSNALAMVESVKSTLRLMDTDAAGQSIASAIALHAASLVGGNSPTVDQRGQMLAHLQDAHEALTGRRMPAGMKAMPTTLREFETTLREMGFSHSQAKELASQGLKFIAPPSGEESDLAIDTEALADLKSALSGFSLSI